MEQNLWGRRQFLRAVALGSASIATANACGVEPNGSLREPVHRVAKANHPVNAPPAGHPLDPALDMARQAEALIQSTIDDYTATIVAATASVSAALAIGGVIAEHAGWYAYFAFGGIFTIFACFVFYMLFDKIEAIVEERDRREAALNDQP